MQTKLLLLTLTAFAQAAPLTRNVPITCEGSGKTTDCSCRANRDPLLFSSTYQLNDFSTDCSSTVNNACAVGSCSLYAHIHDAARSQQEALPIIPRGTLGNSKYDHTILDSDKSKWLILPGSYKNPQAITGVEDLRRDEGSLSAAWNVRQFQQPIINAVVPGHPVPASILNSIGFAINPSTARSKHQMHIHVGRVKKDVMKQLTPTMTKLTPLQPVYNQKMYAIYQAGEPTTAFADASKLMTQPAADAKAPNAKILNHHSVMVAPSSDGNGFYLVIGWDQHPEAFICKPADYNMVDCAY
jgi:hypothetical protein